MLELTFTRLLAVCGFGVVVSLSFAACSGDGCIGDACDSGGGGGGACLEDGEPCASATVDCCGFCDGYCWSDEGYFECEDVGSECTIDDDCCGYCVDGACVDVP